MSHVACHVALGLGVVDELFLGLVPVELSGQVQGKHTEVGHAGRAVALRTRQTKSINYRFVLLAS